MLEESGLTTQHSLPSLFVLEDIETKAVLRAAALAYQALGEVKGVTTKIPSPDILIGTLSLQEASAKEVHSYAQALQIEFEIVKKHV